MKKIVVIGGGTGTAKSVRALKTLAGGAAVSAVVSMSDSGGSSGKLREELGSLPPGDIMRAILAMSPYDFETLRQIFRNHRFEKVGKLSGHNLGNIFLSFAARYAGDFMAAVRAFSQALGATGEVYPATLEQTHLVAALDNGDLVKGEAAIDRPQYDRSQRIKKVWLEPAGKVYDAAAAAVKTADYLVLGPSSLYTSLAPAILPSGMRDAVAVSPAKIIFIPTIYYDRAGETGPWRVSEMVSELETYLPRPVDFIICNEYAETEAKKAACKDRNWEPNKVDLENLASRRVTTGQLELGDHLGIDTELLSKELSEIINGN